MGLDVIGREPDLRAGTVLAIVGKDGKLEGEGVEQLEDGEDTDDKFEGADQGGKKKHVS